MEWSSLHDLIPADIADASSPSYYLCLVPSCSHSPRAVSIKFWQDWTTWNCWFCRAVWPQNLHICHTSSRTCPPSANSLFSGFPWWLLPPRSFPWNLLQRSGDVLLCAPLIPSTALIVPCTDFLAHLLNCKQFKNQTCVYFIYSTGLGNAGGTSLLYLLNERLVGVHRIAIALKQIFTWSFFMDSYMWWKKLLQAPLYSLSPKTYCEISGLVLTS